MARGPGLSLAVLTVLAGCAQDRYFGDWSGDTRQAVPAEASGSAGAGASADATPTAVTQPGAEPVNLLDTAPESLNPRDKRLLRVAVYLDILRVEVPLGTISESYKIWNHLDEQALGAARIVTLKRNGLRAGVGRPEAWEPIKAVLDGIADRLVYHESANLSRGVLSLEISDGPDDQTVFFFRRDGTMAGETFPASRNLFQIMYQISPDDPSELTLKVIPEIRQNRRKLEWSRRGGRHVRVPVYRGRTLHELATTVTLSSGRFLAIGPGHEIELASVVGRALLTREVEGRRYESIFFLTPRVVRSGLGAG